MRSPETTERCWVARATISALQATPIGRGHRRARLPAVSARDWRDVATAESFHRATLGVRGSDADRATNQALTAALYAYAESSAALARTAQARPWASIPASHIRAPRK